METSVSCGELTSKFKRRKACTNHAHQRLHELEFYATQPSAEVHFRHRCDGLNAEAYLQSSLRWHFELQVYRIWPKDIDHSNAIFLQFPRFKISLRQFSFASTSFSNTSSINFGLKSLPFCHISPNKLTKALRSPVTGTTLLKLFMASSIARFHRAIQSSDCSDSAKINQRYLIWFRSCVLSVLRIPSLTMWIAWSSPFNRESTSRVWKQNWNFFQIITLLKETFPIFVFADEMFKLISRMFSLIYLYWRRNTISLLQSRFSKANRAKNRLPFSFNKHPEALR